MGNGVCFVAMPFGADAKEEAFYKAWFRQVYKPAIESAGVACGAHHFAEDNAPVSINKDIFEHLLNDELAIFDLAGLTSDAAPNPNVMYELGVRHSFGKASVIFGWEGQRLPFDVGTQRAVMAERTVAGLEAARSKMVEALKAAKAGKFYNPLEGIAQAKQIAEEARHDPAVKLLAENVAGLQEQIKQLVSVSRWPTFASSMNVDDNIDALLKEGAVQLELLKARERMRERAKSPASGSSPLLEAMGRAVVDGVVKKRR